MAAAHAGWRGTAAGVAAAAAVALVARGAGREPLLAALGPAIGPCCYEVGDELSRPFGPDGARSSGPARAGGPTSTCAPPTWPARGGRASPRAGSTTWPTARSAVPDLYHSYRRDGPGAGRMISFVGFRVP